MRRQLSWLLLATFVASCGSKEKQVKPEMKLLTSAVYASGTLLPEQEYKVVSQVDGYLVDAHVKEGDTVYKGQLLFTISNEVRNAQEQGTQALVQKTLPTVSNNSPMLSELKGRIEVSRIKQQQDSLNYVRYKNLFDQNAVSKSSYEKAFLQYQSSLKEYGSLREQYRQQQFAGDIQLQQARNQWAVAAAQSNVGNLKSYVDGIIYDVYRKAGDLITPAQPVALIGTGNMYAKLLVDESDLDKMAVNQQVLITMDAFPDKVFKAHISKVYPLLNKIEQSFRVDAIMDEPIPVSMYGLNLEANIVVADKRNVMAIPREAVMKGDTVIIKENGDKKKIKIKKGIEDENWVEVRGGLTESSTIIIP
jgi:HlyD family secretion protein